MYSRVGTAAAAAGTLPFTGLELGWTAMAGVTLLAVGGALWRLAPRASRD
ncbi:MAG TPA: hypothetical protein VN213_07865 [Solirubrobacteraceae bacterium]|nr:hypothetical protein [Solirubrobacteraceae bacterium]